MDRNSWAARARVAQYCVALRKESVDRNIEFQSFGIAHLLSLSARRAWIEIGYGNARCRCCWSLSARRAWIEIWGLPENSPGIAGRSPQGERG